MSKLCEAFNRINSKFGANRVKLIGLFGLMRFEISGFGTFVMTERHGGIRVTESNEVFSLSHNSMWLEAIANGKSRDEAGNMVDPK